MTNWLIERAKNLPFYSVVILALGFVLYSAFIKPTQTIKPTNGGIVNISNGEKEVPIIGCSMFRIKAKVVWQ